MAYSTVQAEQRIVRFSKIDEQPKQSEQRTINIDNITLPEQFKQAEQYCPNSVLWTNSPKGLSASKESEHQIMENSDSENSPKRKLFGL